MPSLLPLDLCFTLAVLSRIILVAPIIRILLIKSRRLSTLFKANHHRQRSKCKTCPCAIAVLWITEKSFGGSQVANAEERSVIVAEYGRILSFHILSFPLLVLTLLSPPTTTERSSASAVPVRVWCYIRPVIINKDDEAVLSLVMCSPRSVINYRAMGGQVVAKKKVQIDVPNWLLASKSPIESNFIACLMIIALLQSDTVLP